MDFQGATLTDARFQGAYLNGAQFRGAILFRTQFQGAVLRAASFVNSRVIETQFQGADLSITHFQGGRLEGVALQGAFLEGAQLQGALFSGVQLQGSVLDDTHLEGAWFKDVWLQGASLKRAQLQGAMLDGVQLQGADFMDTVLDYSPLSDIWIWRTANLNCSKARVTDRKLDDVIETGVDLRVGMLASPTPMLHTKATPAAISNFVERSTAEIPDTSLSTNPTSKKEVTARMHRRLGLDPAKDDTQRVGKRRTPAKPQFLRRSSMRGMPNCSENLSAMILKKNVRRLLKTLSLIGFQKRKIGVPFPPSSQGVCLGKMASHAPLPKTMTKISKHCFAMPPVRLLPRSRRNSPVPFLPSLC